MGWVALLTLPGGMLVAGVYLLVVLFRQTANRARK